MKIRFKTTVSKLEYYLSSIKDYETIVDITLTKDEHAALCYEMGAVATQYRGIKITVMKD